LSEAQVLELIEARKTQKGGEKLADYQRQVDDYFRSLGEEAERDEAAASD
jgi:hypothetical protein